MIWICSKQIFIQKITQSLCRSQRKFCPFLPLLPFVYLLNGPPNKILLVAGIYEPWNSGLYDCPTTMYLLTEWEGRTGKYLAWGQDIRTDRSKVRASYPRAKYFPAQPDLTQSISILSYDHFYFFHFHFLVERGRAGAVRVFPALSLRRVWPSYRTFLWFSKEMARGAVRVIDNRPYHTLINHWVP